MSFQRILLKEFHYVDLESEGGYLCVITTREAGFQSSEGYRLTSALLSLYNC